MQNNISQEDQLISTVLVSVDSRTKVITVLVIYNTQLYFLLFEKLHQPFGTNITCKVCKDMMSIYSLE